ncbi:MAG: PEP-CTERM sorting domain-containing protein [Phycisphaeraceae bacterium]
MLFLAAGAMLSSTASSAWADAQIELRIEYVPDYFDSGSLWTWQIGVGSADPSINAYDGNNLQAYVQSPTGSPQSMEVWKTYSDGIEADFVPLVPYASLSAMLDDIEGTWSLDIRHNGTIIGAASFAITADTITQAMFPAAVPITSPVLGGSTADPQPTMTWSYPSPSSAPMPQVLIRDFDRTDFSYWENDEYIDLIPGDEANWPTSYTPAGPLTPGEYRLTLLAGWDYTATVSSDWSGTGILANPEGIVGLGAGTFTQFQIVPEPATFALLGLGALACCRRRG